MNILAHSTTTNNLPLVHFVVNSVATEKIVETLVFGVRCKINIHAFATLLALDLANFCDSPLLVGLAIAFPGNQI